MINQIIPGQLKVPMKRNFFSYESAYEIKKIGVYQSLISYLVLELQSFEDTKIKAQVRAPNKQINQNQSESIKLDQICDVTYIACRFYETNTRKIVTRSN